MQEIEKNIINNRINEVLKDWCLDDKPDYLYLKCFGKPFLLPIKSILGIKNNKEMLKKGLLVQNTNKGDV